MALITCREKTQVLRVAAKPPCFIASLASFPILLLLLHQCLSSSQKPVCCSPNMTFALCSLCLKCSSPESTQLTPLPPLNRCPNLTSSMRTTLSPYVTHNRSPPPNGSFNPLFPALFYPLFHGIYITL